MFFDISKFYLLLLYSACPTPSITYFNFAVYCFRQPVKCVPKQVKQILAEIRNWEEEEEEGDLS